MLRAEDRRSFDRVDAGVQSTVSTAMQRDMDFVAVARTLVALYPNVTNAEIEQWFRSVDAEDRYLGSAGLVYVERVPAAGLSAYQSTVLADPTPGASQAFTVLPPGSRPNYCLPRLEVIEVGGEKIATAFAMPLGIDWCAGLGPQLEAITHTGGALVLDLATLSKAMSPLLASLSGDQLKKLIPDAKALALMSRLTLVLQPVYRPGAPLDTPTERDVAVMGWVGGAFDFSALAEQAAAAHPGWSITLSSGQGSALLDVGHSAPTGAKTVFTNRTALSGGPFNLTVLAPRTGNVTAGTESLVATLVGSALAVLLATLVLVLATSRIRLLRLVDEKTRELRHRALHDALTGLPNRALLLERADQMLARARRQHSRVGALFIDLDNFKEVNDRHGHDVGDALLQAVAARLTTALRQNDTLGRLGGDEFVVLVDDTAGWEEPEVVAHRLIDVMATPVQLPGDACVDVTMSIGLAVADSVDSAELLRRADVAMYKAKAAGKTTAIGKHRLARSELSVSGERPAAMISETPLGT